jgi:hypothetical protein
MRSLKAVAKFFQVYLSQGRLFLYVSFYYSSTLSQISSTPSRATNQPIPAFKDLEEVETLSFFVTIFLI